MAEITMDAVKFKKVRPTWYVQYIDSIARFGNSKPS